MSRTSLEQIVRPFQLPSVTYPTRIYDTNTPAIVEDPVLMIGIDGTTKVFNESFSESASVYKDAQIKEQSRETSKKRVENPDDSSQYVDVELINKLTTEQGSGKDYKKSTYKFNNT